MQLLQNLGSNELEEQLRAGKLTLHVGPYVYRLGSELAPVMEGLSLLYGDFHLATPDEFIDFSVGLRQRGLWQHLRKQAEFLFDESSPFEPIPKEQSFAFLEWGMNWCISLHANEYLTLHAAAVAKDGQGIILPGVPGAGKSTLCAALGLNGWRILSDEHAMIPPGTTDLVPLCRPVSLKNESIEVIRSHSTKAHFGPRSENTHKGVVAHMKADLAPDSHDPQAIPTKLMVFPKYSTEDAQQLTSKRRTDSFLLAAYHSFNYSLLRETGFEAMHTLLSRVRCYDLVYHDLDWAIAELNTLIEE